LRALLDDKGVARQRIELQRSEGNALISRKRKIGSAVMNRHWTQALSYSDSPYDVDSMVGTTSQKIEAVMQAEEKKR